VAVVACLYCDGHAVVPGFGGIVRIQQCIFVHWCPLRASGNRTILARQFREQ